MLITHIKNIMMNDSNAPKSWIEKIVDTGSHIISDLFSEMSQTTKNILVFLLIAIASVYFIIQEFRPELSTIANEMGKSNEEKAMDQDSVAQLNDEIIEMRRKEFNNKSMDDQKHINIVMDALFKVLPLSSIVTVWKIHDHGGPLNNGQAKYITALYVRDRLRDIDVKTNWNERLAPDGYLEFAEMLRVRGSVYLKDVSDYPDIYKNQTKENMEYLGTKSVIGAKVGTIESGIVFLSASYPMANPKDSNRIAGALINDAAFKLNKLIYDVPESLKIN